MPKYLKQALSVAVALMCMTGLSFAQGSGDADLLSRDPDAITKKRPSKKVTQAQREAAAKRVAEKAASTSKTISLAGASKLGATPEPIVGQGDVPDYWSLTVPNWNYTPPIRKFVDKLPGLGPQNANLLGQYIPVAVPDRASFPGIEPGVNSDYYEIAVVEYDEKLHSDLPPTRLRGYVQIDTPAIPDTSTKYALTYPNGSPILDSQGNQVYAVDKPHYLGPMIIAKRDVPVRLKFTNYLPTGKGGDLFIPVDKSVMGAGMGPEGMVAAQSAAIVSGKTVLVTTKKPHGLVAGDMAALEMFIPAAYNGQFMVEAPGLTETTFQVTLDKDPVDPADPTLNEDTKAGMVGNHMMMQDYTQNRAVVHLHGGRTPWISDGTPHQWITPAGENTAYPEGVSVRPVPDMLNVDSGDPRDGTMTYYYTNQQSARLMFYHDHVYGITRLNVYVGEAAGYMIQDDIEQELVTAGIIPADQIPLIVQDKTFVDADTIGQLDPTWRWGTGADNDGNGYPDYKTGDLWVPHVYMPAQNPYDLSGMAAMGRWHYGPWFWPPTLGIGHPPIPNPYYDPINWPWEAPEIPDVPDPSMGMEAFNDTPLVNGTPYPVLDVEPKAYRLRVLNAANDRFFNLQLYLADESIPALPDGRVNTEVKMVPASPYPDDPTWPADYADGNPTWPLDGRDGGVPDWNTRGPQWIQIGTEGGFLPMPVVLEQRPIDWNVDVTTFNAGIVNSKSLLVAPAERADVIVDFSAFAGKTLILYNDAPGAFPAPDARYDYYTGMPDMRDTGGHYPTEVGRGPNTRTVMQIRVADNTPAEPFDLDALNTAWQSTGNGDGVFERAQDPIIVAQGELTDGYDAYNKAYGATFPSTWPNWGIGRIHDTSLKFSLVDGTIVTVPLERKAIQDEMGETFDDYGRMSGKLGLQLPNPVAGGQTFVLKSYVDPSSENITASVTPLTPPLGPEGIQIWKITHNGVDTHPIHFHLFDVQLINRVGWDNGVSLPDANELGWKDTVRVSPLEDTIVALRPVTPSLPFKLPDSVRLLDPTMPEGFTWHTFDNLTGDGPEIQVNEVTNFGWEYMWHCHILSHEEMEMMRPISFFVSPAEAVGLTATPSWALPVSVKLDWTNVAPLPTVTNLLVERADDPNFTLGVTQFTVNNPAAVTFIDDTVEQGKTYFYHVRTENVVSYSAWSNVASATTIAVSPAAPSGLIAVIGVPLAIDLQWTDNSDNEAGFRVERAVVTGGVVGAYSTVGTVPANQTAYTDLAIASQVAYSYRVIAFNSAGEAMSEAVQIVAPVAVTLAEAKTTTADNTFIVLPNVMVTAVFPALSAYYVQQPDRIAGIRAESATLPAAGSVGNIQGVLQTINGERVITNAVFTSTVAPASATLNVGKPLATIVRSIGGGPNGLVPGMTGMVGLNNVGLLLKTTGKVVAQGMGFVSLSDGSGTIKVVAPEGVTLPALDQMAAITGICSVEAAGAELHPILLVRAQSDVQVVQDSANADVITEWNTNTIDAFKTAGFTSLTASRVLAMVHASIFDAVNSIAGGYQQYRMTVPGASGASKEAAAASAAHKVLSALYPAQAATLDNALAASLAKVPDGQAKTDGIAVGQAVADAMVTWRSTDHSGDMTHFMGGTDPGQWRPTPPDFMMGMMSHWPTVTPFAMASGSQFRLAAPPALDSPEYAQAVNEVKEIGRKNSATRTAEQTSIAHFWADSPGTVTTVGRWNVIAQEAAIGHGLSLEQKAHLFALLNISLADAGISVWDTKYYYALWRPITAVREAASDGNNATVPDAMWMPELMTPAFPEYVSAHSMFSAAAAEVLKRSLGSDLEVIAVPSLSPPLINRHYGSYTQVVEEAGLSRIYGGIHFRFSDDRAQTAGRTVAGYVLDNFLQAAP